jgi:hypothetical protein
MTTDTALVPAGGVPAPVLAGQAANGALESQSGGLSEACSYPVFGPRYSRGTSACERRMVHAGTVLSPLPAVR